MIALREAARGVAATALSDYRIPGDTGPNLHIGLRQRSGEIHVEPREKFCRRAAGGAIVPGAAPGPL